MAVIWSRCWASSGYRARHVASSTNGLAPALIAASWLAPGVSTAWGGGPRRRTARSVARPLTAHQATGPGDANGGDGGPCDYACGGDLVGGVGITPHRRRLSPCQPTVDRGAEEQSRAGAAEQDRQRGEAGSERRERDPSGVDGDETGHPAGGEQQPVVLVPGPVPEERPLLPPRAARHADREGGGPPRSSPHLGAALEEGGGELVGHQERMAPVGRGCVNRVQGAQFGGVVTQRQKLGGSPSSLRVVAAPALRVASGQRVNAGNVAFVGANVGGGAQMATTAATTWGLAIEPVSCCRGTSNARLGATPPADGRGRAASRVAAEPLRPPAARGPTGAGDTTVASPAALGDRAARAALRTPSRGCSTRSRGRNIRARSGGRCPRAPA